MLKLKLQYFFHLMQRADSLEKTLILGKTEVRRRRGRQRMRWLDSITNSMDMNLHKLQEIVSDKDAQCAAVHRVSELDATWQLNNNMVVLFFLKPPQLFPHWLYQFTLSPIVYKSSLFSIGGSDVKESTCNAEDPCSISGLGISPGEGNGHPLQYSYLGNLMDRGAWWTTIHGVTKEQDTKECLTLSLFHFSLHPHQHLFFLMTAILTGVEKTLESPLDCKEIKPVNSKGNQR